MVKMVIIVMVVPIIIMIDQNKLEQASVDSLLGKSLSTLVDKTRIVPMRGTNFISLFCSLREIGILWVIQFPHSFDSLYKQ